MGNGGPIGGDSHGGALGHPPGHSASVDTAGRRLAASMGGLVTHAVVS